MSTIKPALAIGSLSMVFVAALCACVPSATTEPLHPVASRPLPVPVTPLHSRAPLAFERNDGQVDDRVEFLSRGPGYVLFLTADEAVFSLDPKRGADRNGDGGQPAVVRMSVVGSNPDPAVEGLDPVAARRHYLVGNDPSAWQRDVPNFSKVRYDEVYPGIDLVYYGNHRTLEYDFVVAPGADPGRIAVALSGIEGMRLDGEGNLLLATAHGDLVQRRPHVYQERDGKREVVPSRYRLEQGNRFAFELGAYDRSRELVIDPEVVYGTFLGGSNFEIAHDVAVDSAGYAHVVGMTRSVYFPTTDGTLTAPNSAFIATYSPLGELVYSTVLAGTGTAGMTEGLAIELLDNGELVVAGTTSHADFPLAQPTQSALAGGVDFFLARLGGDGSTLEFATYLGGSGTENYARLATDEAGNAYLLGQTSSADFPVAAPLQSALRGPLDLVLAKVGPSGALAYSTYLGGTGAEQPGDIDLDAAGAAYVTGHTSSHDFPVTTRRLQNYGDAGDAFVSKLSASGTELSFSTFLGSGNGEMGQDILVNPDGRVHVTGWTYSGGFPTTVGSFEEGTSTGFLATLNQTADRLLASTPVSTASGNGLDIDANGRLYVAGGFYLGGGTWSVTRFSPSAEDVDYQVTLDHGTADALGVDGAGNVVAVGFTVDRSFPTSQAAQPTYGGGGTDAIIVKLGNLAPGDLNGDGTTDVVWRHATKGANAIWNGASGADTVRMTDIGDRAWKIVAIANFDGDLQSDVLWRNMSTGQNAVWPGGRYQARHNLQAVRQQAWQVAGTGDFNDNGSDDILWYNSATGQSLIWYPDGSATRFYLARVRNLEWYIAGVGDFDEDGRADVLWRNSASGRGTIWKQGLSHTTQAVARVSNPDWNVVAVDDFDGDDRSDLLWRNTATGANTIWLAANGAWQRRLAAVRNTQWAVEGTGDYDADDQADILWRNQSTGANVVWSGADADHAIPVARVRDTRWQVAP